MYFTVMPLLLCGRSELLIIFSRFDASDKGNKKPSPARDLRPDSVCMNVTKIDTHINARTVLQKKKKAPHAACVSGLSTGGEVHPKVSLQNGRLNYNISSITYKEKASILSTITGTGRNIFLVYPPARLRWGMDFFPPPAGGRVTNWGKGGNPGLKVQGILLTKFNKRTNMSKQVRELV